MIISEAIKVRYNQEDGCIYVDLMFNDEAYGGFIFAPVNKLVEITVGSKEKLVPYEMVLNGCPCLKEYNPKEIKGEYFAFNSVWLNEEHRTIIESTVLREVATYISEHCCFKKFNGGLLPEVVGFESLDGVEGRLLDSVIMAILNFKINNNDLKIKEKCEEKIRKKIDSIDTQTLDKIAQILQENLVNLVKYKYHYFSRDEYIRTRSYHINSACLKPFSKENDIFGFVNILVPNITFYEKSRETMEYGFCIKEYAYDYYEYNRVMYMLGDKLDYILNKVCDSITNHKVDVKYIELC